MCAGAAFVPSMAVAPEVLPYNCTSVALVVVGGTLVLHQRFTGRLVAKSSVFVAKSTYNGTLTWYQARLPAGTVLVSGTPLASVPAGAKKFVLANVKFKLQLSRLALLVAPARLSRISNVHNPRALVPLRPVIFCSGW